MYDHANHGNHSNATDAHGSTNFKVLYEEIAQATGFSMKKELNALITEAYFSGKYSTPTEKSAALTVGMQKISEYLYKVTLTELIGSDDPDMHALGVHAINVSFHQPNMHGGRGHSGEQDRGSFELMHVLNPRKDTANVKEYFFNDKELNASEAAELRDAFQSGKTFADYFGQSGGMSADGLLGQSLHPFGLVNLAEWAGLSLSQYEARGSFNVSYQFQGYDSNNVNDVFLGIGKKGHGGPDRSAGAGRDKFEQTLEVADVEAKLDFVAGRASGTADAPDVPAPTTPDETPDTGPDQGHDHDGHNHAPEAVDDVAQTAQNRTIRVDVLGNDNDADGDKLTLTDVQYDGNSSLVSIEGNKIKVNPLSAHRDDRTETITYTVQDADGATSTGTLKVDIGKGAASPTPPAPNDGGNEQDSPAPSQPDVDALLEFYFIDTATDEVISKIENGGQISAAALEGQVSIYAIDVEGDGVDIGGVRMTYDGQAHIERVEPYALFGNRGDNHFGDANFDRGMNTIEIDILGANRQMIENFDLMFDVV